MSKLFKTLLFFSASSLAHAQSASHYELTTGAIIAPELASIYTANPEGKVIAINAENGRISWTSATIGRPISVSKEQLVVIQQTQIDGKNELVLLDLRTGAKARELPLPLGAANAVILPLSNQSFSTTTERQENGVRVYWEFEKHLLQGAAMVEDAVDSQANQNSFGAFDINFAREPISIIEAPLASPADIPRLVPNVPVSSRIAGISGEQFRSANRAHVQTSQAQNDARFGTVFNWSIAKPSGEALGSVTLPYAYAPFSVFAADLLTLLPPYAVRLANGGVDIFAVRITRLNLQTGAEVWSVDVLDPVYRGLLPP